MPQPSLNIAPLLRPLFQGVADYESGCRAKLHSQVTHSCHTHPRLYLVVIPTHPPHPRTHHLGMHKPMPYLHPCSLTQGPGPSLVPLLYAYLWTTAPFLYTLPSLFPSLGPHTPAMPVCLLHHSLAILCQSPHCKALATNHTSNACHPCCCACMTWKQDSFSCCVPFIFASTCPNCNFALLLEDSQT